MARLLYAASADFFSRLAYGIADGANKSCLALQHRPQASSATMRRSPIQRIAHAATPGPQSPHPNAVANSALRAKAIMASAAEMTSWALIIRAPSALKTAIFIEWS
ncbi:MAG TPA: hypothetical protein VMV54_06365 [Acidocella sp.]|nr:hypothetical protein [Acidocella sp.]